MIIIINKLGTVSVDVSISKVSYIIDLKKNKRYIETVYSVDGGKEELNICEVEYSEGDLMINCEEINCKMVLLSDYERKLYDAYTNGDPLESELAKELLIFYDFDISTFNQEDPFMESKHKNGYMFKNIKTIREATSRDLITYYICKIYDIYEKEGRHMPNCPIEEYFHGRASNLFTDKIMKKIRIFKEYTKITEQ